MHLYRVLTKSFEPGSFFFRESRHYSIHLKDGRQILQVFYSASVSHPRHDEIRQPPVAFNTKQTKFCLELQALKYEGWFSWSMMKFHFIDSVFLGEFFVIMLKIAIKCCWISKCQALNRFNDWILRGMLPTQKAETGAKPANYPWKKAWEKSMMFMHVVTVCLYVHLVFQNFSTYKPSSARMHQRFGYKLLVRFPNSLRWVFDLVPSGIIHVDPGFTNPDCSVSCDAWQGFFYFLLWNSN